MTLTKNPNNITLDASVGSFRFEVNSRMERIAMSLNAIQNKEGLYAWEHRRMLGLYREVLDVIDRRYEAAKIAREEPLPPVDDSGLEIHF